MLLRRLTSIILSSLFLTLAAPAQEEAKSFRLFVGVDLQLKDEAVGYRSVRTLRSHQVVLDEPGRPVIPLRNAGPFSWAHRTKLSRAPITIADFEQHRAYSLRNNRALHYLSTQNHLAAFEQERTDWAGAEVGQTSLRQSAANRNRIYLDELAAQGINVSGYIPLAQAQVDRYNADAIQHAMELGQQAFQSDGIMSDETMQKRALDAAAEGDEDVMELTFSLSSPDPIADAYVVVMGAIKQDDAAGVVTFHHPVGAIGPEPRKITIRKTGFQPGFTIEDVKLHVYAHGRELGTNLSERAAGLTRDQAREFLLLSHIADHAVESVPPTPVWDLAPAALFAASTGDAFDHPVIVTVDADGSIIRIHDSETAARAYLAEIHDVADLRAKATPDRTLTASVRLADREAGLSADHTGRLPPAVVAAMQDMVFLPALDLGTPVPGTATVNLADFFR